MVLSENVAVATYCRIVPLGRLALMGVTVSERATAELTFKGALPINPWYVPVMLVSPVFLAVARPLLLMLATLVSLLVHTVLLVTSRLPPLLKIAVALNCCVVPAGAEADAGLISSLTKVAVLSGPPPPQACRAKIETTQSSKVRMARIAMEAVFMFKNLLLAAGQREKCWVFEHDAAPSCST